MQMVIIDKMLDAAAGNEEKMFAALVKVHGPEPPSTLGRVSSAAGRPDLLTRLKAFYSHYKPNHNKDLIKISKDYESRDDELIAALVAKYGPEPLYSAPNKMTVKPKVRNPAVTQSLQYLDAQNKKFKLAHQRQLLRVLRGSAEQGIYAAYYFRWSEFMWWSKNQKLLMRVTDESNCTLLKEKFIRQQLTGQVAVLKNELAAQEITNRSTSLPPGDLSPDIDIYQVSHHNLSPNTQQRTSVASCSSKALSAEEWANI
eukprot:TRINITY_DN28303_c0_g1_i1.p1 TRINITY_DN28303_c0_g1~~TRINITY_DN28303_c0_g1_i1.p1  ORF type:complete len:302 (+),score=45.47 TRINITY_DN28303_c0_g1_i1:136-906(+)